MGKKKSDLEDILKRFCEDIEVTGGVVKLDDGNHALATDEDWIDLADTYLKACRALGREPKVV